MYLSVWLINCHYISVSGLMPLNQTALSVIALTKPMVLCVSVNLSLSLSLSLHPTSDCTLLYYSQGNVTLRQPLFFFGLSVCLSRGCYDNTFGSHLSSTHTLRYFPSQSIINDKNTTHQKIPDYLIPHPLCIDPLQVRRFLLERKREHSLSLTIFPFIMASRN